MAIEKKGKSGREDILRGDSESRFEGLRKSHEKRAGSERRSVEDLLQDLTLRGRRTRPLRNVEQ